MKVSIIISIFIFLNCVIAYDDPKEIKEARKDCSNDNNINDDGDAIDYLKHIDTTKIPQNIKCYWKCFLVKLQWVENNGNFRQEPKLSPDFHLAKYSSRCMNTTGIDDCEKGYNFVKCLTNFEIKDRSSEKSDKSDH